MDLFIERAKGGAITTVDEDEADGRMAVKDYEDHSGTPARLADMERRIAALEARWKDHPDYVRRGPAEAELGRAVDES